MPAVTERPPSLRAPRQRSTVGPGAELGRHVMYDADRAEPLEAQAWAGWPVGWDVPSGFGYGAGDPDGYLSRVATTMNCVDINSRTLGSMPVYEIRRNSPGTRHELPTWAENPEPLMYSSWSDFAKTVVNSMLLYNEAILYALSRDSAGFPSRFVALNPRAVEIEPDGAGSTQVRIGGREVPRDDILMIPYQRLPMSVRGIGPLEWACRSFVTASVLEEYAADIAKHGVWAVLKHPGNLSRKQADDLKANWSAARMQSKSIPAVLSGGVEFDALSLSPTDMALLDLRVFDEQRIAAAMGVPPFLVALPNPGGMTYNTASGLFEFHWRATLRPLANTIADAMSAWLLPRGRIMEFDRDEYTRPSLQERSQAYAVMANIEEGGERAISVDEIRRIERLEVSI